MTSPITVQFVGTTGELVEVDLPGVDAFQLAAGQAVAGRWGSRRYLGSEALARLNEQIAPHRDRLAGITARMDQLKAEWPELGIG